MMRHRTMGTAVSKYLVHEEPKHPVRTEAIAPGVRALPWRRFLSSLP